MICFEKKASGMKLSKMFLRLQDIRHPISFSMTELPYLERGRKDESFYYLSS